MEIDTAVGSLRERWSGETGERLATFEDGFASLTTARDEFPWGVYRRRLGPAPTNEVTLRDVMREMGGVRGLGPPMATATEMAQRADARRAPSGGVEQTVERVRASLARWDLSWKETDEPLERLDGLDPRALEALRAEAAQKQPGDVERGWLDRLRSATIVPRWKRAFPQLASLDVENMLLPCEPNIVLYGLPYTVGSAPALQKELRALGSGAFLLEAALELCVTRGLPLFIGG